MQDETDHKPLLGRRRRVFTSPRLHRLQRRHFVAFDLLPMVGTAAALAVLPWLAPSWSALVMGGLLWLGTGLGISVGYHRLLAHRAFATRPGIAIGLVVLGSMAGRGSAFSWVAMHRRHHELADHVGDPHSPHLSRNRRMPRLRGFVYAHVTWMLRHDYPNVGHYIPDLLADPRLRGANRRYYHWVLLGLAIPATVAGLATHSIAGAVAGLLWGGAVRMFLVEQTMSTVNSVMHMFGARPFSAVADNSRNFAWLALPSWGEAWHNNHHAFPYSAAFGLGWRQPDPGFWAIKLLAALGLAWAVKVPAPERIDRRRLDAAV